mmetsp:Transcript_124362/g.398235  ORF Transcript_124362/g.398235 Transcript_124362/m.398235 type:complete len:653 (+) Transcript_124362:74-2032(+)
MMGAKRPRSNLGPQELLPALVEAAGCDGTAVDGASGKGTAKPLIVLGVGTPTHDTGACLARDGVVLHAVNEERFSRKKLDDAFPSLSIAYVLEAEGLRPQDVDVVALGLFGGANGKSRQMLAVMQRLLEASASDALHERLEVAQERDVRFANLAEQRLLDLGFERAQIRWFDHHLCHAFAAFHCSPFDSALVVTFDGRGDCLSGAVYEAKRVDEPVPVGGEPPGLELVAVTSFLDSVAYLYSIVTQLLGFRPFHHEGKVTGLAAQGCSRRRVPGGTFDIFSKAVWIEQECRGSNPRTGEKPWVIRTDTTGDYYKAFSTASPPKLLAELRGLSREDIAAGLQDVTEHVVCEYLRRNGYLAKQMCVAGGLFANVKLNQRFRQLPGVDNVYVFPHMGDGGIHIGAALLASVGAGAAPHPRALTPAALRPWRHVFLGPCPDLAEIRALAEEAKCLGRGISVVEKVEALGFAEHVAGQISDGRIVGLAYGRMEFGPRALGHRSLLAEARDRSVNERLNARLRRTEFMPLAPATLPGEAGRCFRGWRADHVASQYMTMCYDVTEEFRELCPAAVHIDGTARPQVVLEDSDDLYALVIRRYIERTGLPALVNTSFNAHGEPIVCSAKDAWRAFFEQDCCDVLALYPFIFSRSDGRTPGQ